MMPLTINDVPIHCINEASVEYRVPAKLIVSVLKTEDGHNGLASPNKNGTSDLGPMQINSSWLPALSHYGFSEEDVQYNPCKNVEIGAWILSTNIANEVTIKRGIGDYNSHTNYYNLTYSKKVLKELSHIETIIGS